MIAKKQRTNTNVCWTPFYKIVSLVLSHARLNYFSDNFKDALSTTIGRYAIFLLQMLIGSLCLIGLILPNNYDLEDDVSCIIIFFTLMSIASKALTMIYYNKLLKKLVDTIISETGRENMEPWEYTLAKKYYRYSKITCIKVMILYSLTMVSFIGMPLMSSKSNMMPILIEIPGTNRTSSPGYEINYILGAYCVFYGTTIEIGFDIPAFLQAWFISFELDRFIHHCEMIGDFNSEFQTEEQQSKLLKNCIKFYADIFDFFSQVARINTTVVLLTVMTTVPLQIVLLYSILLGSLRTSPVMLITAAYHLFLYCFLGEVVCMKCQEASNAIYNSQWYNLSKIEDRRTLQFFLRTTQRDMRFSAHGMYNLSLETFTELMKLVYAASGFLNNVI